MKHFAKISLRRIFRDKVYTIVNITSLSLGMASAILILLFLRFETSYDNWHTNRSAIYRVGTDLQIFDQRQPYAVSSAAMAPALVKEYPQFTSYLRIFHIHYFLRNIVYQYDSQNVYEKDVYAVDSTFFDFFSCRFLEGEPNNALNKPYSIVLTESMAQNLIGRLPALGEKIWVKDAGFFTVTGVIEDPPLNTHFRYKALISIATLYELDNHFAHAFGPNIDWETFENTFGSTVVWSYVMATPDFQPESFIADHWQDFHSKYLSGFKSQHHMDMDPIFQSMHSIYLDKDLLYDRSKEEIHLQAMTNQMIWVFLVIALFLILTAAINYTNIAISNFNKKRKEMAMVKVLGSGSKQLFMPFFAEAFISVFIGLLIALFMVELILPEMNNYLGVALSLNFLENYIVAIIVVAVFIFTVLLAGLFPAVYFARKPVIKLLVNRLRGGKKSVWLKKVLITFQISIAAFMISTSFLAFKQMQYMEEIHPGYNFENIAVIELHDRDAKKNIHVLDSLLCNNSQVIHSAASNYIYSHIPIKHTTLMEQGPSLTVRSFYTIQTTGDYLNLMGTQIRAGEQIINPKKLDKGHGVFINQAMVDSMGFENPIGKTITTHFQFLDGRFRMDREIIGVMEDIHYAMLHQPVEPLIVLPMQSAPNYLSVSFGNIDREQQEEIIKSAWQQFDSFNPLQLVFQEDVIENFYARHKKLSQLFKYFAYLCVLMSFLGIYGITAYNMEQRNTEISIRKVLGASWTDIFQIFFTDYIFSLILACLAGILLSYFVLKQWLQNFFYAMDISLTPFLLAALLISSTILSAIAIHAIRSLFMNPSSALKYE